MTERWYDDVSTAEVFAYRDLVRARQVPKLALLAKLMRETGGPIEEMDGSLKSMVPLWMWARRIADEGFPGISKTVVTVLSVLMRYESLESEREYFVGELIDHYVFEVVKNIHPDASWEVIVRPTSKIPWSDHHQIGIKLSDGRVQALGRRFGAAIEKHITRDPIVESSSRLKDVVSHFFEVPDGAPGVGSSILVPLLGVSTEGDWDRLVVDDSEVAPAGEGVFSESGSDRPEESELVFAVIGTDPEELESAKPLKAVAVAEVLARHGFVDEEDRPVRASSFVEDISEFESEQVPVLVSALVTGRKLRALFLEIAVEDPEVKAFIADLDRLGEKLGARLGPTDLMENPQ